MRKQAPILIGFCYLFLVMTSYYILKPVRESFFLGEQGYKNLPVAHLLVLTGTFFTMLLYSWAARKLGPARLVFFANLFFVACIALFWVTLTQFGEVSWLRKNMAWIYFCWVSVFAVFAVTLFWSVVHTIFTAEGGSKSYGFIGAGATIGAMTGGFLTQRLAEKLGTENLLLVAAGLLSPCLILGWQLSKYSRSRRSLAESSASNDAEFKQDKKYKEEKGGYRSAIQIFRQSPYLSVLGAIVFLTILISVFDDYRGSKIISEAFPRTESVAVPPTGDDQTLTKDSSESGKDETGNSRTAFFGKIYFYTNIIGLFFSFVLTGPVQTRFGPAPGMYLYTIAILATGIAFLIQPSIHVVFWASVVVQSVSYSIFQWSRELLYTVTTAEEKFVAKGVIDTFLFRAGAAGASITLLVAAQIGITEQLPDGILSNATRQMSYITIPAAVFMMGLIWWISRQFRSKAQQSASATTT